MRSFFEEGDLLVAEVQAFFADGAMSLHTRSLKYGKVCVTLPPPYFSSFADSRTTSTYSLNIQLQLRNGQLVTVPPILIRRLKSHFYSLPCGVDLILGLNGYVWVSKHVKDNEQEGEEGFDAEAVYSNLNDVSDRFIFVATYSWDSIIVLTLNGLALPWCVPDDWLLLPSNDLVARLELASYLFLACFDVTANCCAVDP